MFIVHDVTTLVKWVIIFLVIVALYPVGYYLLFLGATEYEGSGESNIPLLIGKAIMWPSFVADNIGKAIFRDFHMLPFSIAITFHCGAYLLCALASEEILNRIRKNTDR